MTASATAVNVLLDLDGTLTDPGDGFVSCVTYALSKVNCNSYSHAYIRKHVGPPLEETLKHLLGESGSKLELAVAFYRERYGSHGYLENAVYPGVEEALQALTALGAALFVATSKPTSLPNASWRTSIFNTISRLSTGASSTVGIRTKRSSFLIFSRESHLLRVRQS